MAAGMPHEYWPLYRRSPPNSVSDFEITRTSHGRIDPRLDTSTTTIDFVILPQTHCQLHTIPRPLLLLLMAHFEALDGFPFLEVDREHRSIRFLTTDYRKPPLHNKIAANAKIVNPGSPKEIEWREKVGQVMTRLIPSLAHGALINLDSGVPLLISSVQRMAHTSCRVFQSATP